MKKKYQITAESLGESSILKLVFLITVSFLLKELLIQAIVFIDIKYRRTAKKPEGNFGLFCNQDPASIKNNVNLANKFGKK